VRRLAIVLVVAALGCSGKKKEAVSEAKLDAAPAAALPKYGVIANGAVAPAVQGQAPVIESLLEVLATRQAAMTATPVAVTVPKRGFVAAQPIEDHGDFKVVSESSDTSELHASLQEYITGFAGALNEAFKLPRDIPILMRGCGEPNMFYDPDAQQILVCDEILPFMIGVFQRYRDDDSATLAGLVAVIGGFFHELGHCMIHQYELPSTGREEDAADQFATLFLLGGPDLPDDQRNVEFALTSAEFWMALGLVRNEDSRARYWDEHSLDEVRYYEILCLAYGVAPNVAGFLVDDGDLPVERGQRCPSEYKSKHKTWKMLLTPYLKEGIDF
jgi:hypothetical protein